MSDTPRTDVEQFASSTDIGRGPMIRVDFARQLERENTELRIERDKWRLLATTEMWLLVTLALLSVVLLCSGCTLGTETPSERRDRSRWEKGSPWSKSWEFRDGRWEETK